MGPQASLASASAAQRAATPTPRQDKARAKALAKIDAESARTALLARIERSLAERYIIKRAPILLGAMAVGSTEYRFRGDSGRVAFVESKLRLSTDNNSPSVARSMVELALARGWKGQRISGAEDFRRMVWLEASVQGVKALGYEPHLGDLDLLKRERDARLGNRIEPSMGASSGALSPRPAQKAASRGGGRKAVLAAVEAVLIEKKVPEAKRQAVLAAAEDRLAQWVRNGQAPRVKVYDRSAERQGGSAPHVLAQHQQQDRAGPAMNR